MCTAFRSINCQPSKFGHYEKELEPVLSFQYFVTDADVMSPDCTTGDLLTWFTLFDINYTY